MTAGTIAVLGPGGVGGLLAGALERAGTSVVVVAREETAALIGAQGLQIRSSRLGEFTAHPRAVAQLREPVAALIVATKAPALAAALERVAGEPGVILPLLNGLDHLPLLRERYPAVNGGPPRVLAGSVRVQSQRPEPGVIVHPIPLMQIEMACADARAGETMAWLRDVLAGAGADAAILDSESQVMWSKLVRLNALACATSAYDLPLGPIRDEPASRDELRGAVREGAQVARAEGADVTAEGTLAELDALPGNAGSSLQRDIATGRPNELDAIPGAVLRAAARHGVECPSITRLVDLIVARTGLPRPLVGASA